MSVASRVQAWAETSCTVVEWLSQIIILASAAGLLSPVTATACLTAAAASARELVLIPEGVKLNQL